MGFFKDYKDDKSDLRDDFSQALDELIPGGDDFTEPDDDFGNDDMLVNTLDLEDVDTKSELSKLNGLLEQVTESSNSIHQNAAKSQRNLDRNFARDSKGADIRMTMEDRKRMNEEMMTAGSKQVSGVNPDAISDEVTVITEGTNIKGDIASDGSVDIRGRIVGNVTCNGKLVITDDGMPTEQGEDGSTVYTSYALGEGAIEYEDIGAKVPYEMARDPKTNGGQDTLYTRQRKVFSPKGISYEKKVQASLSPTDAELENGENWDLVHSGEATEAERSYIADKVIAICRIKSKG